MREEGNVDAVPRDTGRETLIWDSSGQQRGPEEQEGWEKKGKARILKPVDK